MPGKRANLEGRRPLNGQAKAAAAASRKFDLMDYLRRSTEASGVPLYVEDLEVIHQAAKLMAAILRDQNFHSMSTRSGSKAKA